MKISIQFPTRNTHQWDKRLISRTKNLQPPISLSFNACFSTIWDIGLPVRLWHYAIIIFTIWSIQLPKKHYFKEEKRYFLVKFNWRLCQKLKVIEAISYSGCEATSNKACTINIDSSEPEKLIYHNLDQIGSIPIRSVTNLPELQSHSNNEQESTSDSQVQEKLIKIRSMCTYQ